MSASLLVVTVAFRSDGQLPTFLRSVAAATTERTRVVIVNNGPPVTVSLEDPAAHVSVELLESGANPGYGGGVNMGARRRQGERWLLISNPDLTFDEGAVDELIRVAGATPDVGMVGPLIVTPHGEIYPSARRLPSLRHGVGHALLGKVLPRNPWTRAYLADRENPPRERDAGWLSGSCLLMPAEVFESVGGFDESYFMYFEDVDLAARTGAAGRRIVYAPSARVTHIGGVSTATGHRRMVRAHHDSAYLYLSRRYRGPALAPVRAVVWIGLAVRGRVVRR